MAFQYTPVQLVDMSHAFEPFRLAMQARREQDDRRAELLLRKEQSDRDQARLDEQVRRQGAAEERQAGLDTASAIPKIKNMLTPGHVDYDPESAMSLARAHGINLQSQAPTMPTAPERPEMAPSTPDANGLDVVSGAAERAPAEAVANGAIADQYAGQMGDYQQQLARAQRMAPTYSGTSRIGPVNFDPNAAVASREERDRVQRERNAPLIGAANDQFRPVVQAMLDAGMPGDKVAAFIQEQQKELHTDEEKKLYSVTAEEQMRHNRATEANGALAAADRSRATASNEQNRNDATTNRNLTTYLGTVKEFENTAGVKPDVAMMKNLGKIHEELTSNPQSPVAQAAAIDTVAQIAQGGKASQGVMSQINSHALGPAESAYDKLYQIAHNGQHSPAWVKSMSDTVAGLRKYATDEQTRVMTGFEAAAGDQSPFAGPEYSQMRDSQRRKLAAALGMDVPPPRQAESGAMRPGSGKRPEKSNPIIDARKPKPSLDDLAAEHGL